MDEPCSEVLVNELTKSHKFPPGIGSKWEPKAE